jgi:hypothetical protein
MGCVFSKREDNVFEAEEIQLEEIKINDLKSFYEHMNNLMSANLNRYEEPAEENGEHEEDEEAQMAEEAEQAEQPANLGPYLGNPFGNPFVNEKRSHGG